MVEWKTEEVVGIQARHLSRNKVGKEQSSVQLAEYQLIRDIQFTSLEAQEL